MTHRRGSCQVGARSRQDRVVAWPDGPTAALAGPAPARGAAPRPASASAAGRARKAAARRRQPGTGARCAPRATGRAGRPPCARPGAPRRPRAPASPGLSRLIELHAFNAAGDAAVAISLAGTLFFQVPTGEARGQVALFLGLTMLPFAIVAPLIGPFLDRFSHGRRWAIGATMASGRSSAGCSPPSVATDSALALPGRARRARRVQGVRRHPRRRRTPAAPRAASRWSRPTAGSRWPAIVGAAVSAPIAGAGLAGRAGVVAALRVRGVRDRHHLRDPAAGARSTPARARAADPARRGGQPAGAAGSVPDPRRGRVRAARQLRAALAVGLPDSCSWRSCCASTRSAAGSTGRAADRPRDRRGRPRQHPRHRAGLDAARGSTRR